MDYEEDAVSTTTTASTTNNDSYTTIPSFSHTDRNHHQQHQRRHDNNNNNNKNNNNNNSGSSMAACMLIRNDNHLLLEWVAYHYTVLPLRYLIVGSDVNSTQDPMDVLSRWNGTDLQFQVWYAESFTEGIRYVYKNPVYKYVRRQTRFLGKCFDYFYTQREEKQQKNISWLAMVDSDEYITWNPLNDRENRLFFSSHSNNNITWDDEDLSKRFMSSTKDKNETLWDRIGGRKMLRQRFGLEELQQQQQQQQSEYDQKVSSPATHRQPQNLPLTVLDFLEEYTAQHGTLPCHTLPRVRYSASMTDPRTNTSTAELSKAICHPTVPLNIASAMNPSKLSTIRYLYHVPPEEFLHNAWGKVLLDLRRINWTSMPYRFRRHLNPHIPFRDICRYAYVPAQISLLRVNHYTVSEWSSRSKSRSSSIMNNNTNHSLMSSSSSLFGRPGDPRHQGRNLSIEAAMASTNENLTATCGNIHGWLKDFVTMFGISRAKYLLGQEDG